MRRRSRACGEPAKAQRRKTVARKSRVGSKAADPKCSSAAREETKVARLTRERDAALQRQTATADENTRLLNELRESLQQQTATADVLEVISRSTFDLQAVLNTLVESAARLCEADTGAILRQHGDYCHLAANYRMPKALVDLANTQTFAPGRGGLVSRVLLEGKSVQVPDVLTDPEYTFHENARLGGYCTILGVPLLREGIPIGMLNLFRAIVRPFTEKQIELLETFADQAVIAIENTRLFEAEQQRTRELSESLEQQTATSEILRVISNSVTDVQPVFAAIAASATRLCDAVNSLVIRFDGRLMHLMAHHNVNPERLEALERLFPFPPTRGSVGGRSILSRVAVQVADITNDHEYVLPTATTVGYRTALAVPMLHDDVPIGTIVVARDRVAPFSEKHIALLQTFADQAVIAIKNARLFEAEQERTRELSESLEQQTATSEVLQVISSSPGDLKPVFDAVLANAARLCEAKFSALGLREGDAYRVVAIHNATHDVATQAFAEFLQREPLRPVRMSHLAAQ